MIRVRTAVRAMPAIWFGAVMVLFAGWYVTQLRPSDGYGLDATAKSTLTMVFLGSFAGAAAAWEGGRLRRAGTWTLPSVRSRVRIALVPIVIPLAVTVVAVIVAAAFNVLRSDGANVDIRVLAVATIGLVSFAIAGFASGLLLPIALAVPVALVVPFTWLAIVPALDPVWLRHLTGVFRDCCGLSEDLSPVAVLAAVIVQLGTIAASIILVSGAGITRARLGLAIGTMVTALAVAASMVGGMTYAPVVARDAASLECHTGDAATVCVWPEHLAMQDLLVEVATRAQIGWSTAGLEVPTRFTEEAASDLPADTLSLLVESGYSRDDIIRSLASGMLPPRPDCPLGNTGGIAFEYLEAMYAMTAGMSEDGLRQRYAYDTDPYEPILPAMGRLVAAPPEIRAAWIDQAMNLSQACDDWDPTLIAVP